MKGAGTVRTMVLLLLAVLQALLSSTQAQVEQRTNLRAVIDLLFSVGKDYYFENNGSPQGHSRFECPQCDSSVYSYCTDKLLHDACCCLNPYEHNLPRQCRYADCSFLHANSCEEHKLITACCCSRTNFFK